jgi:hypothetical protein
MENNIENASAPQIERQQEKIKKLLDEKKRNSSPELELAISRETDLLRHLTNAAKGSPRERARKSAETARKFALNRAIQQLPEEE